MQVKRSYSKHPITDPCWVQKLSQTIQKKPSQNWSRSHAQLRVAVSCQCAAALHSIRKGRPHLHSHPQNTPAMPCCRSGKNAPRCASPASAWTQVHMTAGQLRRACGATHSCCRARFPQLRLSDLSAHFAASKLRLFCMWSCTAVNRVLVSVIFIALTQQRSSFI